MKTEYQKIKNSILKYQRSVDGLIAKIYSNQRQRCRERNKSMPKYDLEQLRKWCKKQDKFSCLYSMWIKSKYNKNKTPSIDKINPLGNYTFENMQLMTWSENHEKGGIITTLTAIATVATIVFTVGKIGAAVYVIATIKDSALHIGAMIVEVIYWAGKVFLGIVTDLYGGVLSSEFLNRALIKDPIVTDGWQIVRSFANMLVVLAFVLVGIATILRLREYEAQKLLAPLIIVAILINFSPLICGLIIDAANITMGFFLQPLGGNNAAALYYDALYNPENIGISSDKNAEKVLHDLWHAGNKMEHWQAWFVAIIQFAAYNWIAGIAFAMLALLLIVRQAALACLIMLSPLAFVCYAIPPLREKIWGRWWQEFLSWTFTGVAALFFIYLGTRILIAGDKNALTASGTLGSLAYITPLVFIYIAKSIIRSTSAMGANAVLGLAAGVGGFALGKVKAGGKKVLGAAGKGALGMAGKTARGVADNLGLGGVGGKISSVVGNTMERIGLRKTGVTAQKRAEKIGEAEKRMKDMSSEELAKVATKTGGRYGAKEAESVAASKLLLKQNAFETIDAASRPRVLARLRSAGVRDETLEKADYHLGEFNDDRVRKISQANPGFSPQETREKAVQQVLDENIANMSHDQLRNIDASDLTYERVSKLTPDKIRAFQYASGDRRNKIRAHGQDLIDKAVEHFYAAADARRRNDQAESTHQTTEGNKLNGLIGAINNIPPAPPPLPPHP